MNSASSILFLHLSFSVPSAFDLGTDYRFAETLKDGSVRCISYLFISLPLTVYFGYLCRKAAKFCFLDHLDKSGLKWLGNILEVLIFVSIWGSIVCGVALVLHTCVWTSATEAARIAFVMKILATVVGSALLGVKVLAVFVHTKNMKMISVKATNYEGVYESSLQLVLVFYVKFSGRGELDVPAMLSSLLMIGKSGAENFLTFKENKLAGKSILTTLKMLSKISPPFLFTAVFRISTLSLCFSLNELTYYLILPVSLILPFIFLSLLKLFGYLKDFSMADLYRGTAAELTSIVLWGDAGREGSRKIQVWIGGYLLVTYSVFLLLVSSPKGVFPEVPCLGRCKQFVTTKPAPPALCFGAFIAGCFGYTLSIYQLYLFGK